MQDILQALLKENGIKLVYTANKTVMLSTGYVKGKPVIRADKIFKGCTVKVAKAIEDYYLNPGDNSDSLDIIREYARTQLNSNQFIIKPPQSSFRGQTGIGDSACLGENLKEMKVSQLTYRDFWGRSVDLSPEETIRTGDEGIYELDITVEGV